MNSYVESKFQLSRFYRLLVIKQINPRMQKFANKNNGTTRSREVPITSVKLTARDIRRVLQPIVILRTLFRIAIQHIECCIVYTIHCTG